jgi:hypothetical protein
VPLVGKCLVDPIPSSARALELDFFCRFSLPASKFEDGESAVVVLSKLMICNAVASAGGILNCGMLTVNRSILSNNYAASDY